MIDGSATQAGSTRRAFLGLVGSGAAATFGVSGVARGASGPTVTMAGTYFDPVGLFVEPGTTVRFEIAGGSHSATAYPERIPTAADAFDSGVISGGAFEHTFEEPGTYDYYCTPHESMGMVGRVVVGDPGGPAESGPIPSGTVPESDLIVAEAAVSVEGLDGNGGSNSGSMGGGSGRAHGSGGMMGGGRGGPPLSRFLPIGVATAVVSTIGGLAYWLGRRNSDTGADDEVPNERLERRYARGEIDRAEFKRRRDRLQEEDA
jgi:plastocyanin/uncharacterized membrane protein